MRASLLLIAAMMTAGWAGRTLAAETNDADYYPLKVGNQWTYDLTSDGEKSTLVVRIVKEEEVDGVMLYRLEAETDGEISVTEHLRVTDEGVYRCRRNGAQIEPPLCVIKFPIKQGDNWEGEARVGREDFDITGSTTLDEVEVPFGKFSAAKVIITTSENGMKIRSTDWFAPGVGMVKQVMRFGDREMLYELVDFTAGA
ncbi:MAG TPA: hypothetical protein VHD36_00800 [Pirellulales bacterium]|nr:hypothetical protein [Pirellulales bacterium]